jgi:hypothetical protein
MERGIEPTHHENCDSAPWMILDASTHPSSPMQWLIDCRLLLQER